ncbi:MAG: hypothetical protein AB8I08_23910 [Sandaracinaceae bacterium]
MRAPMVGLCLLGLCLGLGSPAHAQDTHTRWQQESDAAVLSWVAGEAHTPGEERLFASVSRDADGGARVVHRGVASEGDRATVFEHHYRALDYELTSLEVAPSAEAARCQRTLASCTRSTRLCVREARRCVFGRQTLSRGGGAELILMHPVTPAERRSEEREAILRFRGVDARVVIPASNPIDGPHWADSLPELSLAALSPRRRALVLEVQQPGDEDPPRTRQYFLLQGGALREIRDPAIADTRYDSRLPGDGTIVIDENPYTACERLHYPEHARRSRVVVRVSDDGQVRSARRQRRPGHWDCRELPACPFVDREDRAGGLHRRGEILRNVRHEPDTQELAVGDAEAVVRLRIAEEKPEVTHLDAVWLRIGDARLLPSVCDEAQPPSYCEADGQVLRLEEGDTLELEFHVPARLQDRPAFLGAHGMYVPLE